MAEERSNVAPKLTTEEAAMFNNMRDEDSKADRRSRTVAKSVVGQFGIVDDKGKEINVVWVRSERRVTTKPKPELQIPTPVSAYGQSLMASCFKNW